MRCSCCAIDRPEATVDVVIVELPARPATAISCDYYYVECRKAAQKPSCSTVEKATSNSADDIGNLSGAWMMSTAL
jgi:hypothetical protein